MSTRSWIAQAIPIKQVDTLTFALTWTDNDDVDVTIGNRTLSVAVVTGGTPTTADVAAMVSAAINAASATSDIQQSETRNAGGQEMPEFVEVVATYEGSVVTLTAKEAGTPFTCTISVTTFGTGTGVRAASTACTGPKFADNADNWSDNTLPGNLDTARFDHGNSPCCYSLDYFRANSLNIHLIRTTRYRARIGLPKDNPAGYREYRGRFWQLFDVDGSSSSVTLESDPTDKTGGATYLNADGQTISTFNVRGTGLISSANLVLVGGTITLNAAGGTIDVGPDYELPPSTAARTTIVAGAENSGADLRLTLGPHSGIADTTQNHTFLSGKIFILTPLWVSGTKYGTLELYPGADITYDSPGGGLQDVTIYGGQFTWIFNGAGILKNLITVWTGGTLDISKGTANPTYTGTITAFGGSSIRYRGAAPGSNLILNGCFLEQINLTTEV